MKGLSSGVMGESVAAPGDMNQDGHDDYAVSQWGHDLVQVCSGLTGQILQEVTGPADSWFGDSVAGLGDVDGDGYVLDSFNGIYPHIPFLSGMHGTLDATGLGLGLMTLPAGFASRLVGQEAAFAVIVNEPGFLPSLVSARIEVEIVP